ncbi:hypothetical protein GCM10010912_68010 [Paenibacillus albidus]|uniref:Uncharacterized protein n=1 Tax=Paenibacillus albidus TaxID=2041023 RepID=A0A917FYA9_9BACL|nr:hypothetical protein [Paenibacillus albidus]GGG13989.1 hypothetical protein GCM10010912_68010 [Paenibacillus albidus]
MIKEKIKNLYDEIDDDSPDVPEMKHMEYSKRMTEIVHHFEKCLLIKPIEAEALRRKILEEYGEINTED